jgi:hypothetical protein
MQDAELLKYQSFCSADALLLTNLVVMQDAQLIKRQETKLHAKLMTPLLCRMLNYSHRHVHTARLGIKAHASSASLQGDKPRQDMQTQAENRHSIFLLYSSLGNLHK